MERRQRLGGVWHLKETSGTHYDSTGNNNDSTSVTVTAQGSATGKVDGADDFNGTSNNIVIGDSASLDITNALTIAAWAYPDALSDRHRVVTKGGEAYVLRARNSDDLEAYVDKGGTLKYVRKADILATTGYQYVVMTWNESGDGYLRLYHNGAEVTGYAVQ
jgi:hypothetical protein